MSLDTRSRPSAQAMPTWQFAAGLLLGVLLVFVVGLRSAADAPASAGDVEDGEVTQVASGSSTGVEQAGPVAPPYGDGLTMFRGNPSRTFHGTGPMPDDPHVLWRYPDDEPLCGESTVAGEALTWCGSGWTGQPAVHELDDGRTEVVVGAYDGAVHFLDAATGRPTRASFQTGDIIKGSVALDPDGYPLLYTGSRDGQLHVVALDREAPTQLYALDAHPQGLWNDDWDANPVVLDDLLVTGGEDSFLHALRLNRRYDEQGLVQVDPQVVAQAPGFDDELLASVGDHNVSFEGSPTVVGDTVYLANSGGRVLGVDLPALRRGDVDVVFDYWMGDDVDATIVADGDGMLYVAAELERFLDRAAEVGQLVKLDPSRPDDPRVWGLEVGPNETSDRWDDKGGMWATPALHDGTLYVATHAGELLAVDTATGEVTWRTDIGAHAWSSPVVVDDTLVVATCVDPELRGYDVSGDLPRLRWRATGPDGCIESTPAVWGGRLYVGSRDGHIYAFGEEAAAGH